MAIGRVRRDFGQSFVSLLLSDREREGGSWNRVLGPDFQWRPNDKDIVTGQLLLSDSQTPDRPDLAEEWDGRTSRRPRGRRLLDAQHADARPQRRVPRHRRRLPRRQRLRAPGRLSARLLRAGLHVPADEGLLRRLRTYLDRPVLGRPSRRPPASRSSRPASASTPAGTPSSGSATRGSACASAKARARCRAAGSSSRCRARPSRRFSGITLDGYVGQRHRLRRTPARAREREVTLSAAPPPDRPPRAAPRRAGPLARRRRRDRRRGPPLHRPGRPRCGPPTPSPRAASRA